MAVPGFEPGSSGSQPLMLTTTLYHHLVIYPGKRFACNQLDNVAERLRRQPAKLMGYARVTSNLTVVESVFECRCLGYAAPGFSLIFLCCKIPTSTC